jgi:hypothetical protein
MTFTFPRVSAGIYEIQKNDETVGFIRKQTATKWIITDVVDTPQHVTKTLKEAKVAAETLIIFDNSNEVEEPTEEEPVNVMENVAGVEGSLSTYSMSVRVRPSHFGFEDTEEDKQIPEVVPTYGVPTLDPMVF